MSDTPSVEAALKEEAERVILGWENEEGYSGAQFPVGWSAPVRNLIATLEAQVAALTKQAEEAESFLNGSRKEYVQRVMQERDTARAQVAALTAEHEAVGLVRRAIPKRVLDAHEAAEKVMQND